MQAEIIPNAQGIRLDLVGHQARRLFSVDTQYHSLHSKCLEFGREFFQFAEVRGAQQAMQSTVKANNSAFLCPVVGKIKSAVVKLGVVRSGVFWRDSSVVSTPCRMSRNLHTGRVERPECNDHNRLFKGNYMSHMDMHLIEHHLS